VVSDLRKTEGSDGSESKMAKSPAAAAFAFARSVSLPSFEDAWDKDEHEGEDAKKKGGGGRGGGGGEDGKEEEEHGGDTVDLECGEAMDASMDSAVAFEVMSICANCHNLSLSAVLSNSRNQTPVAEIRIDGASTFTLWSTSSWTFSSGISALKGLNLSCQEDDPHKDMIVALHPPHHHHRHHHPATTTAAAAAAAHHTPNIVDCSVDFDPKGDGNYALAVRVAPLSTRLTTSLVLQMQHFFTVEDGRQDRFMREHLASFAHAFDRITPKLTASVVFGTSNLTLFNDEDDRGVVLHCESLSLDSHTLHYDDDTLSDKDKHARNAAIADTTLGGGGGANNLALAVSEILRSNHWRVAAQSMQVSTFAGYGGTAAGGTAAAAALGKHTHDHHKIALVQSFDMNLDIDIHLAVTDRARTEVVTILCIESSLSPLQLHVQPQSVHGVVEMAKV
jgi:hypothetical protein